MSAVHAIAWWRIDLEALRSERRKGRRSVALVILHADGARSVTELIGYTTGRGGRLDLDSTYHDFATVTALRVIAPPPPGFVISYDNLRRILSLPPAAYARPLPPALGCALCGAAHTAVHPTKGYSINRSVGRLCLVRVIGSRSPRFNEWLCPACMDNVDAAGAGLPPRPHEIIIGDSGRAEGPLPTHYHYLHQGLSQGDGHSPLAGLGFGRIRDGCYLRPTGSPTTTLPGCPPVPPPIGHLHAKLFPHS